MGRPRAEMTGKTFNMLKVIDMKFRPAANSHPVSWSKCECACGSPPFWTHSYLVRSGKKISCGCAVARNAALSHTTHGMSRTSEFGIWTEIIRRCEDINNIGYARYGGRGISVSEEFHDFSNFHSAIGRRPSKHYSVDRIDNAKGYERGNVKWSTGKEQQRNTRRNRILTLDGEAKCVAAWAEDFGIPVSTILNRLRRGWTDKEALTEPIQRTGISKIAREAGMKPSVAVNRVSRGWTVEEAISTPVTYPGGRARAKFGR